MTIQEQLQKNGKVSVIVPMYNAVDTLRETVESVQAQTYTNWELILVDDCSKDNTKQFAEELAKADARIKVCQMKQNGGPGAATKLGFEYATGGFVAFIDADDLWTPDKLERQLAFMAEHNYEFVCSDYCWVDAQGKELNKTIKCATEADYKTILKRCPIGSSTVVITSQWLSRVDIPIIRKNNDYALWLVLLRSGGKIYGQHEIFMKYRILESSNSFNKRKMIKYFWQVYREQEGFSVPKSAWLLGQYIAIKALKINK